MMRRREFLTLLGGAATWPIAAGAQQAERMRRIGVLASFPPNDLEARAWVKALVQGLQELGWTDGQNIRIDDRWAADARSRVPALANELVELKPELIVACGGPAAAAVHGVTHSLPIVFVQVVDPVALGLVASLAHPGGNITGFMHFEPSMVGKWVEVLKEAVPSITHGAVIFDPDNPASKVYLRAIETVSRSSALQLTPTGVRDGAEIKRAIEAFAREPNGALIVLPNPVTLVHRELTIGSSIILRGSSPKSLAVPTCVRWRWRRALAPLEREGWRVLSCDDEGMAAQIITVEFDRVEGIEENTIIVMPVKDAVIRRPERRVLE